MNRSKSIADKKTSIATDQMKKPIKTIKGSAGGELKKPKKMKMSSLLPCEFDNSLHEDIQKEEEFR